VSAPSPPSRIARDSSRSLSLRVVGAVVNALVLFVTARGFGADGRGLYALTMLAATFMALPVLGITTPLSAEVAHKRSTLAQLYAASITISFLIGGVIATVGVIVAVLVWPDWAWLGFAAAPLPLLCLAQCQIMLYQAEGAIMRMGLMSLAMSVVTLVSVSVVAIAATGDIYLALLAWAVVQPIVPTCVLFQQRRASGLEWRGVRALTSRLLRRGLPVTFANTILRLNYRVDVFVVAALLPLADVGTYSIAVAVGEVLWELSRALVTGAYSTIAGAALPESARVATRSFRHSALLLVTSGIVSIVGAYVLMGPVLGSDFDSVWVPLALLMPGIVGFGASDVLRVFFLVRLERSREYLYATSGATILNLVAAVLLVPVIGISGAAISTSVSYIVLCAALMVWFATNGGSRRVRDYLPGPTEMRDYVRLLGYFARITRRGAAPTMPD
jgi:O-antigen/teichoic acid export membrane protein